MYKLIVLYIFSKITNVAFHCFRIVAFSYYQKTKGLFRPKHLGVVTWEPGHMTLIDLELQDSKPNYRFYRVTYQRLESILPFDLQVLEMYRNGEPSLARRAHLWVLPW